jgi:hypothetical protein
MSILDPDFDAPGANPIDEMGLATQFDDAESTESDLESSPAQDRNSRETTENGPDQPEGIGETDGEIANDSHNAGNNAFAGGLWWRPRCPVKREMTPGGAAEAAQSADEAAICAPDREEQVDPTCKQTKSTPTAAIWFECCKEPQWNSAIFLGE